MHTSAVIMEVIQSKKVHRAIFIEWPSLILHGGSSCFLKTGSRGYTWTVYYKDLRSWFVLHFSFSFLELQYNGRHEQKATGIKGSTDRNRAT